MNPINSSQFWDFHRISAEFHEILGHDITHCTQRPASIPYVTQLPAREKRHEYISFHDSLFEPPTSYKVVENISEKTGIVFSDSSYSDTV